MPGRYEEELRTAGNAALIILLALTVGVLAWLLTRSLGLQNIHNLAIFVIDKGAWGPLILITLQVLAALTGVIPSTPLTVIAGAVWGPWLGTLFSVIGMQAGALLSFLITRNALFPWLDKYLASHVALYARINQKYVTRFIFISRLLPIFVFELISYGAGLTRIRFWHYFWATLLGIIPMTLFLTWTGRTMMEMDSPLFWVLTIAALALMLVMPWLIERYNPFNIKERLYERTT